MAFRFVPLPPEPISGPEVLAQIEAIITELQTLVNDVTGEWGDLIQEALNKANQALQTANDALEAADNAQTGADQALAVANNALALAQQAQADAKAALARANEAYDLAANGKTTADEAAALATNASETANAAQQTADNAANKAQTALVLAEANTTRIDNIFYHNLMEEATDFNELLTGGRFYLTSATNTNAPPDTLGPYYVNVFGDSVFSHIWQTAYDLNTQNLYERLANAAQTTFNEVVNFAVTDTDNGQTYTLNAAISSDGVNPLEIEATPSAGQFNSEPEGVAAIGGIWVLDVIQNGTITINNEAYGDIVDGVFQNGDSVSLINGSLSGISVVTSVESSTLAFNFAVTVQFGDWSMIGSGSNSGAGSKAEILSLLNVNDESVNPDLLFGYNGHGRVQDLAAYGVPLSGPGNVFVYTDTERETTAMYVRADDGQSMQRTGTYALVFALHNSFYDVTVSNGTNSYTCTLVYNALVGNDVRFNIQVAENGFSMPYLAENGAVVVSNTLTFTNADTAFGENGYTVVITGANARGTQNIELSVAPDGAVTVNNAVADFDTYSQLTLLSGGAGEITEVGFQAFIQLSARNNDYSGSGDWGEWINPLSGITGGLNFIDTFDASAGDYSAITSASAGDFYVISVAGTIGTIEWAVGDWLIVDVTTSTTPTEAQIRQVSFPSAGGGTLTVEEGGTGATTLTGIVRGNGTSPFTAATPDVDYTTPATTSGINTRLITAESTLTTKANQSDLTSLQGTVNANTTKLNGIAAGAQVNVIEAVTFNGTAATISGKTAQISAPAITIASTEPSATDGNNGDIWIVT